MSLILLSKVWDLQIEPQGKKLVMLAFASAADDDGLTWISLESSSGKRSIGTMTSASPRAVRSHVAKLEAEGHLQRLEKMDRGCLWRVHVTPAKSAGVDSMTPANFCKDPGRICRGTFF